MTGQFVVDADGASGGLVLLWANSVNVVIRSFSKGHIDCDVEAEGKKWQFTGFYGNPVTELRHFSRQLLRRVADARNSPKIPWLVGGNFNEILKDLEKQGGRARPLAQMNGFREAILDCNLYEIAYPDESHTWHNKRSVGEVFLRLDRFLGDSKWQEHFPHATSKAYDFFGSDHRPILCKVEGEGGDVRCMGQERFHFEDKWLLDKQLVLDFVYEWSSLSYVNDLPGKLKMCETFLSK